MGAYEQVKHCHDIDPTPGSICQLQHAPYKYIPTLWLGVLFTVLFSFAFIAHLCLALWPGRFRRGGFMLLAVVCAAGEVAGWVSRLISHFQFFQADPYIAQLVSLIISPIFISAANYVALERIILCVGPELTRLSTKTYIAIFVTGDVVSLIVQAAGGGMSATADTKTGVQHGSDIALAGVIIQVLITGPFLMLLTDFLLRHYLRHKAQQNQGLRLESRWTKGVVMVAIATFVSTVFILIRCIYRCVEMKEGWTGYLSTTELWFPIFDGTMIFVALAVFLVAHPSFLLPSPWSERGQSSVSGKATEAMGSPTDGNELYHSNPSNGAAYSDGPATSPVESTFKAGSQDSPVSPFGNLPSGEYYTEPKQAASHSMLLYHQQDGRQDGLIPMQPQPRHEHYARPEAYQW